MYNLIEMKKRPTFGGFITIALLALLALAADNLPASTAMAVGDGEDDGCQANILGEDSQRAQEAWDQFYALDDIYELNLAVPINVRGLHEEASRIRAQCHLSNSETGTRYSSGTSNWEDVSPFTGNFEGVVDVTLQLQVSLQDRLQVPEQDRASAASELVYGCVLEVEQAGTEEIAFLQKKNPAPENFWEPSAPQAEGIIQPGPYEFYQIPEWDGLDETGSESCCASAWPQENERPVEAVGFQKTSGDAICYILNEASPDNADLRDDEGLTVIESSGNARLFLDSSGDLRIGHWLAASVVVQAADESSFYLGRSTRTREGVAADGTAWSMRETIWIRAVEMNEDETGYVALASRVGARPAFKTLEIGLDGIVVSESDWDDNNMRLSTGSEFIALEQRFGVDLNSDNIVGEALVVVENFGTASLFKGAEYYRHSGFAYAGSNVDSAVLVHDVDDAYLLSERIGRYSTARHREFVAAEQSPGGDGYRLLEVITAADGTSLRVVVTDIEGQEIDSSTSPVLLGGGVLANQRLELLYLYEQEWNIDLNSDGHVGLVLTELETRGEITAYTDQHGGLRLVNSAGEMIRVTLNGHWAFGDNGAWRIFDRLTYLDETPNGTPSNPYTRYRLLFRNYRGSVSGAGYEYPEEGTARLVELSGIGIILPSSEIVQNSDTLLEWEQLFAIDLNNDSVIGQHYSEIHFGHSDTSLFRDALGNLHIRVEDRFVPIRWRSQRGMLHGASLADDGSVLFAETKSSGDFRLFRLGIPPAVGNQDDDIWVLEVNSDGLIERSTQVSVQNLEQLSIDLEAILDIDLSGDGSRHLDLLELNAGGSLMAFVDGLGHFRIGNDAQSSVALSMRDYDDDLRPGNLGDGYQLIEPRQGRVELLGATLDESDASWKVVLRGAAQSNRNRLRLLQVNDDGEVTEDSGWQRASDETLGWEAIFQIDLNNDLNVGDAIAIYDLPGDSLDLYIDANGHYRAGNTAEDAVTLRYRSGQFIQSRAVDGDWYYYQSRIGGIVHDPDTGDFQMLAHGTDYATGQITIYRFTSNGTAQRGAIVRELSDDNSDLEQIFGFDLASESSPGGEKAGVDSRENNILRIDENGFYFIATSTGETLLLRDEETNPVSASMIRRTYEEERLVSARTSDDGNSYQLLTKIRPYSYYRVIEVNSDGAITSRGEMIRNVGETNRDEVYKLETRFNHDFDDDGQVGLEQIECAGSTNLYRTGDRQAHYYIDLGDDEYGRVRQNNASLPAREYDIISAQPDENSNGFLLLQRGSGTSPCRFAGCRPQNEVRVIVLNSDGEVSMIEEWLLIEENREELEGRFDLRL